MYDSPAMRQVHCPIFFESSPGLNTSRNNSDVWAITCSDPLDQLTSFNVGQINNV